MKSYFLGAHAKHWNTAQNQQNASMLCDIPQGLFGLFNVNFWPTKSIIAEETERPNNSIQMVILLQ